MGCSSIELAKVDNRLIAVSKRLLLGAGRFADLAAVTLELTPILVADDDDDDDDDAAVSRSRDEVSGLSHRSRLLSSSELERPTTRGCREPAWEDEFVASANGVSSDSAASAPLAPTVLLRPAVTVVSLTPMSNGIGRRPRLGPLGDEPNPESAAAVFGRGARCIVPEPSEPWNACLRDELLELLEGAKARGSGCITLARELELTGAVGAKAALRLLIPALCEVPSGV